MSALIGMLIFVAGACLLTALTLIVLDVREEYLRRKVRA